MSSQTNAKSVRKPAQRGRTAIEGLYDPTLMRTNGSTSTQGQRQGRRDRAEWTAISRFRDSEGRFGGTGTIRPRPHSGVPTRPPDTHDSWRFGAGGGNRTLTGGDPHGILSPARLPVSPLRPEVGESCSIPPNFARLSHLACGIAPESRLTPTVRLARYPPPWRLLRARSGSQNCKNPRVFGPFALFFVRDCATLIRLPGRFSSLPYSASSQGEP